MKNNANNETKKLTLAEMKKLLPTTRGKSRPTARYLRENEEVVASSDVSGCAMVVYASGFAVYKNESHQYVLRLDCIQTAEFGLMEENGIKNDYVPLDEVAWDTAVMLDGEHRIETDMEHRLSRITVSTTGTGVQDEEGEPEDMELDAGVDIAADCVREEEKRDAKSRLDEVLSCLTERQREIYKLYHLSYFSQEQIALQLGIGRTAVTMSLKASEEKIKKFWNL